MGGLPHVAAISTEEQVKTSTSNLHNLWANHHAEWRDPMQIVSQWRLASEVDPALLRYKVKGDWWQILAQSKITLFITREYEHLIIALSVTAKKPSISYTSLPHPSGLVADREHGVVHVASTRNPNQVYDFMPAKDLARRLDSKKSISIKPSPLVTVRSRFYPGCLYIHDLSLINGKLYANAVGQNAVVRLHANGSYTREWWPRCIERSRKPIFEQNHIQLNSIASGANLKSSFFSASTDIISKRRPGHQNFPVDKRGVIFSGATRQPVVRGLTRPHSARLHQGKLWVDNSGYGEFGFADLECEQFVPITRLNGWTRGLCFYKHIAFVGTSRVIPRFSNYAPGLNVEQSICGVHAIDIRNGKTLGSISWNSGNQIFALDWMPRAVTSGFPFQANMKRATTSEKALFYSYQINFEVEDDNE